MTKLIKTINAINAINPVKTLSDWTLIGELEACKRELLNGNRKAIRKAEKLLKTL